MIEENLDRERKLHEEQLAALMQSRLGEETEKFREILDQKEQEFAMREARLKSEFQLSLEQRLGEEVTSHQLQLQSLRAELAYRDETIAASAVSWPSSRPAWRSAKKQPPTSSCAVLRVWA